MNPEQVPTCRTFRWKKNAAADRSGFRIRSWIEYNRGQDGGERIAVVYNEAVVVVAANTGYYLTSAHQ
jgi:hypothetical protein